MSKNTTKDKSRKPGRDITQILADNMRTFRKINKLSQESLAEMCNLHRTYIGAVERGERNVTLSTLELVAGALGVSVPALLTPKSIQNDTPT